MSKISCPFGKRIKQRIEAIGETQAWLAEQLGVSNNAVSKWVSGDSEPKFSNLCDMAKSLKCSVGYLAGDFEDNRKRKTGLGEDKETVLSAFDASSAEQKEEWVELAKLRIEKAKLRIPRTGTEKK